MRDDPVGQRDYKPLSRASALSDGAFIVTAILSITALQVDKTVYPKLYDAVQIAFVVGVVTVFVMGLAIRLYWGPRAEDKRRQDLLSNSFSVALIHDQSTGYYNNDETNPFKRLGAALLENSLFSKTIALEMLKWERARTAIYVVIWIVAALNRTTDLGLAAAMAQAVFSEQLISKWIRLEWLRMRFERVYESLFALFQTTTNFNRENVRAHVIEIFGNYETGKAYGGVNLSSKIFNRLNPSVSEEWERIRSALKL